MRKAIIILGLFLLPTLSFASTYGSNVFTGGTASVDTFYNDDSTYNAAKAADANNATYWLSKSGLPHWWKYVLGTAASAGKLTITKVDADYSKSFSLKYSDNGTDWTEIATGTLPQTNNTAHDFIIDDTDDHVYWKVDFTDAYNGATYSGVREIELFECTDCTEATSTTATSSFFFMSTTTDALAGLFLQIWIFFSIGALAIIVAYFIYKLIK